MILKIKQFLKIRIAFLILNFKEFKIEDSVIICSAARGGSTWLMEILSNIPGTAINWEPLHAVNGVVPNRLKWGWNPFVPKNTKNEVYYNLIYNILIFRLFSKWSCKLFFQMDIGQMLKTKYVLTKFVRANLLLGYIVENFKINNKPILLIRHPIDVCISQLKAFKDRDNQNFKLEKVPDVINNHRFVEHNEYLQSLKSELQIKIAKWCLNNCGLLDDSDTLSKVTIVYYSDLILNPKDEITRILGSLNFVSEKDVNAIVETTDFRKASQTDFKKDLNPNPRKQLYKNFEKLTYEEKESIQKIFDHFNFKLFDAYQPFPNKIT